MGKNQLNGFGEENPVGSDSSGALIGATFSFFAWVHSEFTWILQRYSRELCDRRKCRQDVLKSIAEDQEFVDCLERQLIERTSHYKLYDPTEVSIRKYLDAIGRPILVKASILGPPKRVPLKKFLDDAANLLSKDEVAQSIDEAVANLEEIFLRAKLTIEDRGNTTRLR